MPYADAPRRTLANAAIVEGFFGVMWFGWGQAAPPTWLSVVLVVGTVLSVLVAVGGIVSARRARHTAGEPSPLADAGSRRWYAITVGTEVGLIVLGAIVFGVTGHPEFLAAWTCLVVGGHFAPLSRAFPGIGMVGLAIAVSAVGIAAFIVGAATSVTPSSIAGVGAGLCLLVHGASLLASRRNMRRTA